MTDYKSKSASNPDPHGKPTESDVKIVNTVLRSVGEEPIKSDNSNPGKSEQSKTPVMPEKTATVGKELDLEYLIEKAGYTPDEIMAIVDDPDQLRAALNKGWENCVNRSKAT